MLWRVALSIIAEYETAHETEGSRVYGRDIVFPINVCDRKERLRLFHALGVVANTGVVAELHVFSDYAYIIVTFLSMRKGLALSSIPEEQIDRSQNRTDRLEQIA